MGISASKRVSASFSNSPGFDSACYSSYSYCLSLTQNAFPGVFPYQLLTASEHLHRTLSTLQPHSLVLKWVPSPPTPEQVDSALRAVIRRWPKNDDLPAQDQLQLGSAEFKEWAIELFVDAVVSNAGKAVLRRVPLGIAGITGIGAVTRSGKNLVGAAIGVYALGVATSVYLSLSG